MGLLDFTTDLKSLRYGKDRIGGGSSKEPFITTPIDSTPGDTGGPDFLLRANALQHAEDDTSRIFQYLKSPKGISFALKQNLLSRSAVKTQASGLVMNDGIYLPTSTLAQVGLSGAGSHLLKQGINPFANTTANATNTGIGILDTIGNFLSDSLPLSAPFYVKKVTSTQPVSENRLTNLVDYKMGVAAQTTNPFSSFFDNITSGQGIGGFLGGLGGGILNNILSTSDSAGQKFNSISLNKDEILRYDGGPGSALGIGQTSLKRVTITNNEEPYLLNYSELVAAGDSKTSKDQTLPDFRSIKDPSKPNSLISTALNYQSGQNGNFEERINIGNPGRRNKNLSNYSIGTGTGALDKLNALPLYSSTNVIATGNNIKNDFVKFRIGILDNKQNNGAKTYIHFRAFIDSFADNYNATWSEAKFMGRAESFYRYNGFGRSISMGWTLAAQSVEELIPMYQKLNYLASSLAPDYSDEGYMQGNIAYLTFGGYCFEQPGIITGLSLSYPQESPWEIDVDSKTGANDGGVITKELPMIMTVSGFEFKPIHNFVPRIQQNSFDGLKEGTSTFVSAWGKERYIALENAKGNNYTGINNSNFTKDSTFTVPSSTTNQERGSLFGPTGSNSFSSQATGLNN
tara:strand:- start:4824 stop:6710 length:1887 start_codon:yes stop_codon:yes gene_type:complete